MGNQNFPGSWVPHEQWWFQRIQLQHILTVLDRFVLNFREITTDLFFHKSENFLRRKLWDKFFNRKFSFLNFFLCCFFCIFIIFALYEKKTLNLKKKETVETNLRSQWLDFHYTRDKQIHLYAARNFLHANLSFIIFKIYNSHQIFENITKFSCMQIKLVNSIKIKNVLS